MIKNILTIVFCSFILFSCNSEDEDEKDYSALASQKVWAYVATSELIKKCDINANGQTADLLDMVGKVTLDFDENILVWSNNDYSYWDAYLTVAIPLGADIVSSTRTANKGEMIFFIFNGTSIEVTVEDALEHLDIIKRYYNGDFPSSIKSNVDCLKKDVELSNFGVSSGQ